MITLDLSILNQKGTPMFYSDTLALRPAFGIVGRIFIAIDSPYGIFRDTGSAWDQIAGSGGGGITGSGTATRIAFFSAATTLSSSANLFWDNTNNRLGVNTATPISSLNVLGNTISTNTLTGITGTSPSALTSSAFSNDFTFNSGITTAASVNVIGLLMDNNLNYSGSNTINATSYNASGLYRNVLNFGSAGASVTYTQASGNIRALVNDQIQYLQNGANSGTISHYANIQILGDQKTGAGLTTFTNRYGLLINDFNEFTAGNTYTNRWGIYQAGLNENNFFAGTLGTGAGYTPNASYQFQSYGNVRIFGSNSSSGSFSLDVQNSGGSAIARANNDGSNFICNIGRTTMSFKTINTVAGACIGGTGGLQWGNINGNSVYIYGTKSAGPERIILCANADSGVKIQIPNDGVFVASALLNVESTTQGFLLPRMTTTQKNAIATPAAGLVIYDITLNKLCVYTTAWETITSV